VVWGLQEVLGFLEEFVCDMVNTGNGFNSEPSVFSAEGEILSARKENLENAESHRE
jgi:hypothetical protein